MAQNQCRNATLESVNYLWVSISDIFMASELAIDITLSNNELYLYLMTMVGIFIDFHFALFFLSHVQLFLNQSKLCSRHCDCHVQSEVGEKQVCDQRT